MSDDLALGCAALLAGLPLMTPRRLARLLDRHEPAVAWRMATSGRVGDLDDLDRPGAKPGELRDLASRWAARAAADPVGEARRHHLAGVDVLLRADPRYPRDLLDDHQAPAVLFAHGDLGVVPGPRVAIIGTRRCSGTGAMVARDLGRGLAAAGVGVVSGLALGIDGAAHAGALLAGEGARPPIAVVGNGHDRPYPARHRALWAAVRERGLIVGEWPLGTPPGARRFPARNRIIAALSDVVVVVESHSAGGSLLTVQAAIDRGVPVMAVPGSVRSPAAAGSNQLLSEGCHPVRDVDDVLVAIGLQSAGGRSPAVERRPPPDAVGRDVLAALGWEPANLEQLAVRTGRPVPELSLALHALDRDGWVEQQGPWFEQVAAT